MIKSLLFALALLSLALAGGCAKGGNGGGNGIVVTVSDGDVSQVWVNLSVTFTAMVTGTSNTAVAWTLSGTSCTGTPNPCGTIDVDTGVYQAPSSAPKSVSVTITATSRADSTARGTMPITVVPITVVVATAATPAFVGHGLVQQFTATAVPDTVPQTFTWTCTANGVACANFVSDTSGVAVYTAAESACGNSCVTVSAVSTTDPGGCTNDPKDCVAAKFSILTSRLPTGTYAFRFAGYDASNNLVAVAGSIAVTNGVVTAGMEDELTSSGPAQHTITGGSFTPSSLSDKNTNNAGTLTLTSGAFPNQYQVVLDAGGDMQMIESDGHGKGSGVMEKSATSQFNTGTSTFVFVFGFTGVDSTGDRVGYVGALPMTPTSATTGTISGGQLDANDSGNNTNICGASPCAVGGSYQADTSIAGLWHMTLTSAVTMQFDFFISNGQTKAANPLTLYAISTDPVATNPTASGTMVYQDPATTYNATALNAFSVSNLAGVDSTGSNTVVSLASAAGNSSGNFSGSFDANNAGTIVAAQGFNCTYTTGTGGRYVVTMLGNGSSCTGGIPFVLYASGANRGFLLDQSSAAVMSGAMDPQQNNAVAPSELPSTYAVATVSNATSGVSPIAANLLLTSLDTQTHKVSGTQYPGAQIVTGTYDLHLNGTGPITLTAPAAASYVIYPLDASTIEMIDVDTAVKNAAVIFAQQ
jgi:hypothetical protein